MAAIFTTMMVPLSYVQYIILPIIFFLFLYFYKINIVLSLFEMLPKVFLDFYLLQNTITKAMEESKGTYQMKAGLSQRHLLFTSDPVNIHYILTSKFSKYPKGSEWRKRFDIFGDHGVFNSDFEEWKQHTKIVRAFSSHSKFHQLTTKIIPDIIKKGLIPVLEHVSKQDVVVDLQDLFKRYTYDFASIIFTGCNHNSLCIEFPEIPFPKAMDDACEVISFRHIVPERLWKFQRWLGIGKERKYSDSWKTIDDFWAKLISTKREEMRKKMKATEDEESFNLLNLYLTGHEIIRATSNDEEVMRNNVVGGIFAAEETTSTALSWFFWLLSKNPVAEMNIREELRRNLQQKEDKELRLFNLDQLGKLVYLHAALCETLRLFPPVPVEGRTPMEPDRLPSGHNVSQKTTVFVCIYAVGRMASVWGEDCHEFKPERWITEDGGIKHQPSNKFLAFLSGPRSCPGKEIAFILMKSLAATVIHNYDVQVIESHPVIPRLSITLSMKHGLMARVRRST